MKRNTLTAAFLLSAALLSSCNKAEQISRDGSGKPASSSVEKETAAPVTEESAGSAIPEEERETLPEHPEEKTEETEPSTDPLTELPTEPETEFTGDYVHGTEGYFCLADNSVDVELKLQRGGTCWAFASATAMENSFFLNTGRRTDIDPNEVVNRVYGDDKAEGIFLNGMHTAEYNGGCWEIVADCYSSGVNGVYVNEAIEVDMYDIDAVKESIRKYGGVIGAIYDSAGKRQYSHGYLTFNDTKEKEANHELLIIGWDDHFPKSYFKKKAEQDGAWIAYNSNIGEFGYYYISYDSYFENMSVISATDKYSGCESYSADSFFGKKIDTGKETALANVFHRPGTLAAVGTISRKSEQNIKIEVYAPSFKELVYTQEACLKGYGWHTVELDQPLSVTDYAVVIRYEGSAVVETEWKSDASEYRAQMERGQSLVMYGGKWLDLADPDTADRLGLSFEPKNCCIKAYYK